VKKCFSSRSCKKSFLGHAFPCINKPILILTTIYHSSENIFLITSMKLLKAKIFLTLKTNGQLQGNFEISMYE